MNEREKAIAALVAMLVVSDEIENDVLAVDAMTITLAIALAHVPAERRGVLAGGLIAGAMALLGHLGR